MHFFVVYEFANLPAHHSYQTLQFRCFLVEANDDSRAREVLIIRQETNIEMFLSLLATKVSRSSK